MFFSSRAPPRGGGIHKGGGDGSPPILGADEGLPSLHGEMCATSRTHLLGEKRATARPLLLHRSGECEGGYCRDSSPLTSFTYVRQADEKFEMLCK